MTKVPIIHSLKCPNCGGRLEIEAGRSVVPCPFCGISSLLTGEQSVRQVQVRPTVGQKEVMDTVRRFYRRWDRAPDLEREAVIQESFVVYVPYWQVSMGAAAWLFGRQVDEDARAPIEKTVAEEYVWTGAACDASRFGRHELGHLDDRDLEPFDREVLQQHALVLEPDRSGAAAIRNAERAFKQEAHRRAGLTTTLFQRFQFTEPRLSLIHYPLWVVRYVYRERSYRVVVDGRQVVYGQAPGNPGWQAALLILAVIVGATLPMDFVMWWAWMLRNEPISSVAGLRLFEVGLGCVMYALFTFMIAWLSAAILLAGYRFFRFGGERVVGQKRALVTGSFVPACTWGVGLVLCMALALIAPGRLNVLIPACALISAASLGLGLLIRRRTPAAEGKALDELLWGASSWLWETQARTTFSAARPPLRPLRCPNCQTPVPAREGEVAYLCQGCGWGLELATEGADDALRRIKVAFAAPQPHRRVKGTAHLPFWVFDGIVRIETRAAIKKRWIGKEKPSPDRGEFWAELRQIYVPAFETRLQNLQAWGVELTGQQRTYPPGEAGPLRNCVYTEKEARDLAELVFLGVESGKPDIMQEFDYSLALASPRLLVIPFRQD